MGGGVFWLPRISLCAAGLIRRTLPLHRRCINVQINSRCITYQQDVTMENVQEIIDITANETGGIGHKYFTSPNILRAMTAFAEQPWWTARDENNRQIGHVLVTNVGDKYITGSRLYILPEYRGSEVGFKLSRISWQNLNEVTHRSFISAVIPIGQRIMTEICKGKQFNVDFRWMVRVNNITYNPDSGLLKKDGKGFHLEKLEDDDQFDKLVKFDTAVIHEVPRVVYLKHCLDRKTVDTYLAVDDSSGDVVGYGAIQPSLQPDCLVLAPLYALNNDQASVILHHLLLHVKPWQKLALTHSDQNKFIQEIATEIMGKEILTLYNHIYVGELSVPYKHENHFCWAGSTIVFG